MKMKKLAGAITALAMASSMFAGLATVASAATAVTIDSTTVTDMTNATVSDGVITVQAGGSLGKSGEAHLDLGSINEGIVTLTATWNLGNATGKENNSRAVFEIQDDAGNAIFNYTYYGQNILLNFNGESAITGFSRNQNVTVKAEINLYTKKVTVSGVGSHTASDVAFYETATNVGQIYLYGYTPATSWSNTTTLSSVSYDVVTQTVTPADYTINYVCDETEVQSATNTEIVGSVISVSKDTVVYDNENNKYFVTEDKEMTLVDGTNVLNVLVRAAENYAVTVNATGGIEKNVVTATAVEGDDYSCSYPAYIKDDNGNYYKAEGTVYGETVSAVSAPITKDVTYTLAENVVAVIEGEDYNNRGSVATYSNGKYGYMAATNKVSEQVEVVTLPAGVYQIDVAYHNDNQKHGNRGFYFRDKTNTDNLTNVIGSVDIEREAATGIYTGTMTLSAETALSLTGYAQTNKTTDDNGNDVEVANGKTNQGVFFDYVVITKTGTVDSIESTVTNTDQFSETTGHTGEATAFKVKFTANGNASFNHVKFVVTTDDATGEIEDDVATVSGEGSAVYGVVVDALVSADNLTATASMVAAAE